MTEDLGRMKLAAISGASHVLKFKQENRGASDEDALQNLSDNINSVLEKIDKEIQ
ncbi:MAG: hypothetical protein QXD13_00560 [Candidatus Pacearchaeota archaeon]